MKTFESFPDFLERVHRDDVAVGQGVHKPGHCKVCDEIQKSGKGAET